MSTPREQARARTEAEVVRIGRDHLARDGAAALSLRAVARDLGVVSSAVYRYVPSRDALLTLLVVDAYDELGSVVEAAEALAPRGRPRSRWRALACAVRAWALAEPARYGLLFGTPVPGYRAPAERTTTPGTRVITVLLRLVADAGAAAPLPQAPVAVPPALAADFDRVRAEAGLEVSDHLLVVAVLAWVTLFGAVGFEVFGQYGQATFTAPEEIFEALVGTIAAML